MLKEVRQEKILTILNAKGSVTTNELSILLSVTPETIRKDIQNLKNQHLLKRTFGGIIPANDSLQRIDPSFADRSIKNIELKQKIAAHAASLLSENDIIAIDASTTTLQLLPYIPSNLNITVVTNSFSVLSVLVQQSGIAIICVGGYYRESSTSFLGNIAAQSLASINIHKCFVSSRAIDISRGLMDPHESESNFKQSLIKCSSQTIVLADHSKFDQVSTFTTAALSDCDIIISDDALPERYQELLSKKSIQLFTV